MKRAVALIDGENFYYKLGEFSELRPWYLDWKKFLESITPEGHELIRAYYFKCERIGAYDFTRSLPRRVNQNLNGETPEDRKKRAMVWYDKVVSDYQKQLSDYEHNIASRWADIEIRKVGTLKVDPWDEEVLGEKGLDVGLAVSMVEMSALADLVVLVSGDADYAPAVQVVKQKLKKVSVVRFFSGPPPKTKGTGADLLTSADETIDLYEDEIWEKMVQNQFKTRKAR